MKKNKRSNAGIWKAGLATLMMLAVTGCSATTDSSTEAPTTTEVQTEAANEEKTYEYHESQMEHDKEESVYVLADAYGTPDEITVTTSLKNPGEQEPITDYTVLSDIKNKEGDEEYKLSSDGTLTWENHGRDIQYEGTATKDLPVSVKVTYFLDDKEVTAEELAGATGAVRIRFDYTNHTAEEDSIVPFTVISGLMLKEDAASNVSVNNGKVKMMDGDYLVIGYVVPGVKDVLALDELETFEEDKDDTEDTEATDEESEEESEDNSELFADSIEVSFDAVDFELEFTATLMTNGILGEMDTEKLSEQVEDLADGFDSLHSGTRKLSDALKQLDESGDALVSGASQLQSGLESLNQTLSQIPPEVLAQDPTMAQLAAAVAALAEGSGQLTEGITAYTDGVGQVYEGSTKLNNATYELTQTADDLETAVDRIQALKDTDATYENYGGIEEGKTGSVTFIVETAEIKAEK